MTHTLPEKPEVLAISGRTGLNRFEVVGRLFALWRWFDNNTTDGNAASVTSVTLNECLFGCGAVPNFVGEVVAEKWLIEDASGIRVVKFDKHISESAKQRAQTANRVAKNKSNAKGNGAGNDGGVTKTGDGALPRVRIRERKRKDKSKGADAPFALPDWVDRSAWDCFEEMRLKIKKPMTDRARELIVIELDKLRAAGHPPKDVLERSTRNNWQDVYPLKDGDKARTAAPASRLKTPGPDDDYETH